MAWEEVWRGDSEAEAEIVAGSLSTDGYSSRVIAVGVFTAMPTGLSAYAVVVPTRNAAAARAVLRRSGDRRVREAGGSIHWRDHVAGLLTVTAVTAVLVVALVVAALVGGD